MMIPLYMVSGTSSGPADAPEQAVFRNHLKSNIEMSELQRIKDV